MVLKKSQVIQFLLFLISPILGLISSLGFSVNNRVSPIVLSLSLALICIYMPLMYDVSASFFAYSDFQSGHIVKQLHSINIVAGFFDSYLGLDYFYLVFIVCVGSLYFWFKVYSIISIDKKSNVLSFTLMAIFCFLLSYKELMDLNRSFFSYSMTMFAIFLHEKCTVSRFRTKFLFIGAVLIHPSSLVILLSYYLSKHVSLTKLKCISLLIVAMVTGMLFEFVLVRLLPFVPAGTFLQTYLSNSQWGITAGFDSGKLMLFLVQSAVLISALYVAYENMNDRLVKTFFFVVLAFVIFIKFRVFGERFFLAAVICIPFVLSRVKKVNAPLLLLLFFAVLKSFTYNIYVFGYIFGQDFNYVIKDSYRRESMMLKPMYNPTLFLLNIKDFGYSNSFIEEESVWKIEQYNNSLSGVEQE